MIGLNLTAFIVSLLVFPAVIRRWLPVQGLTRLDKHQLCDRMNSDDTQLLDIRDPLDYEKYHYPNAINIYLGRLPYVNKRELKQNSEIVIIGPSWSKIRKATRILRKAGFKRLTGYIWNVNNVTRCKESQINANVSIVT